MAAIGSKASGVATPVEQSLIQRVIGAARYVLTGVGPNEWFGPGQPLQPVAQDQAVGRAFDYPVNVNIRTQPRDTEAVTFAQMRNLADSFDLLRLIIETRKDQLCALSWNIKPKEKQLGAPKAKDGSVLALEQFFMQPDKEHDWAAWLRMFLEDMLVIDAVTIYPRLTNGGQLYALEMVDGGTIRRISDDTGRTPLPPQPAYQQILKGLPAVDYHRDELLYLPRNVRSNRVYGYSPVEQIIMTVNIALRRQLSQLQYFTEGNIPEAFIGVPTDWNPDQIKMFQEYWDSILEGNQSQKRKAKFIPGGMEIHETRPNPLKDEFDEWLVRVVCFAFSIEPTPFVRQSNRATAQTSRAQSLAEGIIPTMQFVECKMDFILAKWFNRPDLCFKFDQQDEVDKLTQAQIDQIYVTAKIKTPNEVRQQSLNLDPLTPEQIEEFKALNPAPPVNVAPGEEPPEANHGGKPPSVSANPKSKQANQSQKE